MSRALSCAPLGRTNSPTIDAIRRRTSAYDLAEGTWPGDAPSVRLGRVV